MSTPTTTHALKVGDRVRVIGTSISSIIVDVNKRRKRPYELSISGIGHQMGQTYSLDELELLSLTADNGNSLQ